MFSTLKHILSQNRYFWTATISFIAYIAIYLTAVGQLIFSRAGFGLDILPNWQELVFRQRAPFLFEAIGSLRLGVAELFIAIPNLFLAFFLASLVAANITVSYFTFRNLGLRSGRGFTTLLGTIPALISAGACCVPTLIIVIGLQFTATLAAIWPWFVPLSITLLIGSLVYSLRKIKKGPSP